MLVGSSDKRLATTQPALPPPTTKKSTVSFDVLNGRLREKPTGLVVYCASTHLSDPASLTATSEKKTRDGIMRSAFPGRLVEIRRAPAFL